jgi:hypothetical protein
VSANHILQIFLSAENFLEWRWEAIFVLGALVLQNPASVRVLSVIKLYVVDVYLI